MPANPRVRVGSITKTFTAVTLLQLAARGRVSLDAPVARYLPGLIDAGGHDGRTITVRSLLRHTSGLPDHMDSSQSSDEFRFRHFEPEELVRRALRLPGPGAGWPTAAACPSPSTRTRPPRPPSTTNWTSSRPACATTAERRNAMTTSRSLATTAAGLAAAAAVAAPPAVASAAPGPSDGGLARYYSQHLIWKACTLGPDDEVGRSLDEAGARCADVTVPLDYARPDGRTIKIAISRLAASDKEHRIGTMVLNGGGPGPAIDMPPYTRELMGKAGPRYDLVGLDPRSLGRSATIDCGWPTATWIRSAGETRRSFERSVGFARDLAARCARTNGTVLPYISTRNIARDIDVVRGALRERKISYNGASYGTYLGAVYATLFPGRLDRTVLDSSVDPRGWGPSLLANTDDANDRALADWAAWAAKRNGEYGLGDTRGKVLAKVRGIVEASARKPLEVGRYRVDDSLVPVVIFDDLGTDEDSARAVLADSVRVFGEAAAGRPANPTKDLDEELGFLLNGDESLYGSGQSAIICGDAAARRDPESYWRAVQRHRGTSPVFGPLTQGVNPCAFWPTAPREPLTEVGGRLPALMVAATGDTRTIYPESRALHGLLPGSRLITLRGADVHAPYQRGYKNDCVTGQVNDYLLTGRLPARDLTCAPEQ
ncbi:hypothetical protein GCM10009727_62530 [Actinomadura napierensis]|uniref:Alpha/beta fold hydrolase n=2 Tax=Actinomadura napierensis TaxID=267854 RepID=A0ABN3A6U5_9ACTN